ncbi:DUF3311 domain-containing protein [Actinocatenispora thailandica]|uniref:DUF3311 domain-containing protein n=1 Tax=Actinocatenispora thailandica TaxID=227318 RepID=UPI00194FF974|nr:DUF3311 domain-containing protein [Actinocatenispora thailandica]
MSAPTRRRHRLVLVIPYLWTVAAVPAVNLVHASPLDVPLLLWWALVGVLVTTGSIAVVWRLDNALDAACAPDVAAAEPATGVDR